MKNVAFVVFMILVSICIGMAQTSSEKNQDTSYRHKSIDKHQVGFYLIMAEADSAPALPIARTDQQIICYDYRFLRNTEHEKPRYFLLSKIADVPLILNKTPELQEKGENGFPELRLELTSEAARNLERLTHDHLGGKVVFMIDCEPVTVHKIRSAITGGQFRLSRCTDTACQYIFGRLVEKQ
jgi:preprotein translocase subunit SecD